jgi:hypothetical protein
MKNLILFLSLFICSEMIGQEENHAFLVKSELPVFLKQLEGNWVGSTGRELWTPVEDELVIEGISFYNVNFEDYGTNEMPGEHMIILNDGNHWVYLATPLDAEQSTTFVCTKQSESEWVFENPQHDFPKRITYTFLAIDQLQATIDAGPGSSPKDVKTWKYWKKSL